MKTPMLILLLVLNAVVLLGQICPEGAPPFARVDNVVMMLLNVLTIYICKVDANRRKVLRMPPQVIYVNPKSLCHMTIMPKYAE